MVEQGRYQEMGEHGRFQEMGEHGRFQEMGDVSAEGFIEEGGRIESQ
jgi:hypothetical protein